MEIEKSKLKECAEKINSYHSRIEEGGKKLVEWAIKTGELLAWAKENCGHGNYEKWVKENCHVSLDSASRYLKCFQYAAKTAELRNLQDAYFLIESEEQKEKELKQKGQMARIAYREKHGEKPDTWERADDHVWKKFQDDKKNRTKRIEDAKIEVSKQKESKEKERKAADEAREAVNDFFEAEKQKKEKMKLFRLSGNSKEIIESLEKYLHELSDKNRRIEACNDIIKYCRNKSAEYQKA